jgi:hypothetical protein
MLEAEEKGWKKASVRHQWWQWMEGGPGLTCACVHAMPVVSPTKDAEEREKEHGVEPQVFTERFKPLSKYASVKQWREEVHTFSKSQYTVAL